MPLLPMNAARTSLLLLLSLLVSWLAPTAARAQSAAGRQELLRLVPDDFGFCLIVNDLRGNAERWARAEWLQAFRTSPLVRTLFEAPELQQLARIEQDLKRGLDLDWPTLRDDILGDTVLLAYRPPTTDKPDQEQGLLVLRARDAKRLARLVDAFNQLQKSTGELRSLTPTEWRGVTYYRREQAPKSQFYYLKGPVLAVAGSEEMIRQVIERDGPTTGKSNWPERFERGGAMQGVAALCVNPRAFDAEVLRKLPADTKGEGFGRLWRALDAIFVTVAIDVELDLRLTLQARPADLPGWARPVFAEPTPASALWTCFPEQSLLAVAGRADFKGTVEGLLDLLPMTERARVRGELVRGADTLLKLDLFQDVLANLGPDWGGCVLVPDDASQFPQVLLAVAVKPDTKAQDALLRGVQRVASLVILDANGKKAGSLRQLSVRQDSVEVKFLTGDQLLPAGLQPAWALKDGYLLLATSPDAIRRFRAQEAAPPAKGESPLFRLSPQSLARLLSQRREQVVGNLRQKHTWSQAEAERNLDNVLSLLRLFDRVTLSQRGAAGQAAWSLRVTPRVEGRP